NAALAENFQCGCGWNREPAMRAIDPAGAFHHGSGTPARFAEQLQGYARPNDIDNRIDRAHFVEMDLVGRMAVDLAFGTGDALKDCDRLLFDPVGEGAGLDQFFDL